MPRKPDTGPRRKNLSRGFERDLVRLPRRAGFLAFLVGALLVGAGAGLRILLGNIAGAPLPPFVTFYPLLGLIGFLCGARLGVLATIASTLVVWYFWMAPEGAWKIPDRASAVAIVGFTLFGSLSAWIGAWARGLFEKVQSARKEHDRVARETLHRLKNLIAVVQSLSHQTARTAASVADYKTELDKRLLALAQAQDLVVEGGASKVGVRQLVEAATGPFRDSPHFETWGEVDFPIPQPVHLGLTLALGELGANSMKYGALAGKGGKVRISWREAGGRRHILWQEDVPLASDRRGFGSRLISSALSRLPGAEVDYSAADTGIHCRFEWASE